MSSGLLHGNAPSQKRMARNIPNKRTRGLQPRLFYPAKFSIKMEGKIRSFSQKRNLKEYTSNKAALQEMLKGLLSERKEKNEERNTGMKKWQ